MRLRNRLLLGYWYLVALLSVSAAAAALGFHHLGTSIGRILDDNFESIRASMDMLHALEREDSALLASLLDEAGAPQLRTSAGQAFLEAMGRARGNITIDAERSILDEIEKRHRAFSEAADELLATAPDRPLREYEASAFPRFEAVKTKVLELLDVNHRAMVEADRAARATAQARAVVHGLLVVVALLSLVVLSRALGRELLDRLAELRAVAQAIADGDRRRRATVERNDELGLVSRQLNALLDREAEIEGATADRLQSCRHLVLALLGGCAGAAAVVSGSGEVVASTLDDAHTALVERAIAPLKEAGAAARSEETTIPVDDLQVSFRPLVAASSQPIGWLARITD